MRFYDYLSFLAEEKNSPDLKEMYNKFNDQLFDGELPDIRVYWNNSRKMVGEANATINRDTEEITPKSISISKKFELGDELLKGILVHEMAHIYFYHRQDKEVKHGKKFKELIDRLSNKVDFWIPDTEASAIQRAESQLDEIPIVIGKIRGEYAIIPFTDKIYKEYFKELVKSVKEIFEDWKIGIVSDRKLEGLKRKRKIPQKDVQYYSMRYGTYERIIDKMEVKKEEG